MTSKELGVEDILGKTSFMSQSSRGDAGERKSEPETAFDKLSPTTAA